MSNAYIRTPRRADHVLRVRLREALVEPVLLRT